MQRESQVKNYSPQNFSGTSDTVVTECTIKCDDYIASILVKQYENEKLGVDRTIVCHAASW